MAVRRLIPVALVVAGFAIFLAGCGGSGGPDAPPAAEPQATPPPAPVVEENLLGNVLAGEHRSTDNRARDVYRHPQETLEFFGIRPDMAVVEIWPGAGWYTEILAPYLREKGRYIAAHWDPDTKDEYVQRNLQAFRDKLAAHPELFDRVEVTVLSPPAKLDFAAPDSVDLIVTFRNLHNWMDGGQSAAVFAAMYRALKPGGVLGMVEHRAAADQPQDPKAASGYVRQDVAVEFARQAGFVLEADSEINANPRDTKDYAEGVWTLPPTLTLGDKDREKYLAIGESDRFTLRFRKPGSSAGVGEGAPPAMEDEPGAEVGETVAPAP